jgi:hypothetical protein
MIGRLVRKNMKVAEGEGFEPPEPCGSAVFKTAAIDHSATLPVRRPNVRGYFRRSTVQMPRCGGFRLVGRAKKSQDPGGKFSAPLAGGTLPA